MLPKSYKPEWVPENGGSEFATSVMPGIEESDNKEYAPVYNKLKKMTCEDYVNGVLSGDRMILARAITVIESNAPKHFALGQEIIKQILPYTGKAVRVGITGIPGAGKSTFIEALGTNLCNQGKKAAVLAVDPSSPITRGSILGDKTRMENLSRNSNAFIRPSPSGGTLGGVTRKSRETLLLCEAAGYDIVFVETVGVGQGETTVRSMVDFFLVLVLTGAGDELQGIKKGIIELADAILVNKADGSNKQKAMVARADYNQVLHYLRPATEGWTTKAYACSSITGEGINEIWQVVMDFKNSMDASGRLQARRQQQTWDWVREMAWSYVNTLIFQNPSVMQCEEDVKKQLMSGDITASLAAQKIIDDVKARWNSEAGDK